MEFFIKKIFEGKDVGDAKKYFVRFGKGNYKRRFLTSVTRSKKIKVRGSFELANDFVNFVKENSDVKFSGNVLAKDKVSGKEGKKKAGYFVYEISESSIDEFENAYFYLLNVNSDDIVLKIKKSLPKPGKDAKKIDDKFCALDVEEKYWENIRKSFFWDLPDKFKKAIIEHELIITDIIYPEGEKDPVKIRELAKRKGKIVRKIIIDGSEKTSEANFEI